MNISLYLEDKIVNFKLPNEISGSFSFDLNAEGNNLINIEERDGKWVLYQTSEVKIISANNFVEAVPLISNRFYVLFKDEKKYLIYVNSINLHNLATYTYNANIALSIGNTEAYNIRYNCNYLKNTSLKVTYQKNQLILEKSGEMSIYVNKIILKDSSYVIKTGDILEIYGLKILFLNGLLLIVGELNNLNINTKSAGINNYSFPQSEKDKEIEIKDVDLYSKNDYFSKSPRIRRLIETKEVKLSPPPSQGENQEVPMILVVGPMLTMGIMSVTMFVSTLSQVKSGEMPLKEAWGSLITSGAMLVSMLVWPLLTQLYNKHMKKKRKKELIIKYTKYLEEKQKELKEEAELQKIILLENLITVDECLKIIEKRNINFWDKRIDQNDFLVVRLGVGNELLDVKIEYPEEGFTIDEDELRKKADQLVENSKYIENVPIGYSFDENKITAIMGQNDKVTHFMHNILVQLITFYSYEDLKIVLFTNEQRKKKWEYLRYLNHTFTDDRTVRFLAADQESSKNISEYLNYELNNRLNQKEGSSHFKPHYFIIVDDLDMVRRYDFIKKWTEIDDNLGFSMVILEDRLSKLPSKCNNFITIGEKNSGVLKNSYEKQEQIVFCDEINYNIDMMKISKLLSNIPIEFENGIKQLPDSITFLEMEKVGKVEQLNILNRWNTNDSTTTLGAEVGVDETGDFMYLDLHEKAHGPHGLIAGMTGSGKSEFIITYILSMAINYSPDDISFILIDYKGGGLAGAFENKVTGVTLPHLSGTITNLDKAEMDRTLVSIDSEIKRRQKVFNEARDQLGESTIDIYKYQKFYKEGKLDQPVSHLFIICDEFAELKSQQPDFMDNLISVARIGRSLGVHLILATQKPSGVVNDQIWSNTKFRVCLKVQDESDSREMLKRPEAASLKQTGRFYLQVGYDEYFALGQSAWCGAKYYPSDKIIKNVDKSVNFINDFGRPIKSIAASSGIKIESKGEQLSNIMNSIIEVSNMTGKRSKRLWLENIPALILENDLENKYQVKVNSFKVEAILGEYDEPESQKQGLVMYRYLQDGNTIIYGTDGSEREKLLNMMIYSTVKNHSSEEINYYIIDYGSESLIRYNSLSHMGGIVRSGEDEKYHNLLKLLGEEFKRRKSLFVDYGGEYVNYLENSKEKLPIITVIVNNYDSLYESNPDIYDELPDLVRDSERYGIVFIFTANSINSIQSKLSQSCPNIYSFKLKDTSDYTSLFGIRVKNPPRDIEGRGLFKNEGVHEFQTASIISDMDQFNHYITSFIEKIKESQIKAKRIPVLPKVIRKEDIREEISDIKRIPIGISKKELEICTVDYLANIGNMISSNKLINTSHFVKSLLFVLKEIPNIDLMIIDPMKQLGLDIKDFPNYYCQKLDQIVDSITEYIQKLIDTKSNKEGVIFIYGMDKFVSKVKDSSKIEALCSKLKEYEKMAITIVDDASKLKNFGFESWFTSIFNTDEGIWIGRGLSDQNLFHISMVSRDMTKDYKNDMGYYITEGVGTLCRFIDFIHKDGDEENGK